jgi:hypothetical protein
VEARQRTEQRTDQMITGGAAGALLLSITFLDTIAPTPSLSTRPWLLAAWVLLLLCLLVEFVGTLQCKRAFDHAIKVLDCGHHGTPPPIMGWKQGRGVGWLRVLGTSLFVLGVALLAIFSIQNAPFE